jgi:hypothetical protein
MNNPYQRYCALVAEMLQEKVGRPLSAEEQQSLWDVQSMMFLEAWERGVLAAQTSEAVEAEMVSLGAIARQRKEWGAKRAERQNPDV